MYVLFVLKNKGCGDLECLKEPDHRLIRAYKKFLYVLLAFGVFGVMLSAYYFIWLRVPSTIMIKAGVEQELDFKVPAAGELYKDAIEVSGTVSSSPEVNNSVYINLGHPVTIKANQVDQYKLQLRLFGMIPFKEVDVEVIQDLKLKPAGIPIGIYVKTQGVLVVGVGEFEGEDGRRYSPGEFVFQVGDYILEINDEAVSAKKEVIEKITHSDGQEMVFKVQRGKSEIEVKARPEMNQSGEYKMGIWVRDNAQGVGTMTYIDERGCFGALGHGINDVDTSTLMSLSKGTLYHTEIIGITRGTNGSPGELTGFIEYDDRNIMGDITDNTTRGIFGICSPETAKAADYDYLPIGLKQEIKKGPAQIICSLGGEPRAYDIEIIDINLENDNVNRGIVLEIVDPELIMATGGIVQGMSGSPIIQDDKLVGAVTHVFVQDSTRGYGIFVEDMMRH